MGNRDMLDLFDRCRGRETWCVIMQGRVAAGAPRSAAGSGPRAHR
jgi:hypothetical protein